MGERAVSEADVVVIGAGVSGLVTAREVVAAGLSVEVLEARNRVGGRLHGTTEDGVTVEHGGQWLAKYQDEALDLVRELGLETFDRFREGLTVHYVDGQAQHHDPHAAGTASKSDSDLAFDAAVAVLADLAEALDPSAPWSHPRAAELDRTSFQEWLTTNVADGDARDLLRVTLAEDFMTKPAHAFSVLQALTLLRSGGGDIDDLLDADRVLDMRVVGGLHRVPEAIAGQLGDVVHTGEPVSALITERDDRVRAIAHTREVVARGAVIAVPPNLWPTIRRTPTPPGWLLQLEQRMSQGMVIKVQAMYARPFWRERGLSGTAFGPDLLVHEAYDNTCGTSGRAMLCGFIAGDRALEAQDWAPERRREEALDCFARYFGAEARMADMYTEHDWTLDEWTRGAYCASVGVGDTVTLMRRMSSLDGPVRYAATELAGTGFMHMDGAVRSGRAAARSLVAALGG